MEVGKYYIDGEGFYLCEHTDEKFSRFKAVTLICGRVSSCNPQYVTEACDRRFVECPKEVFDKAEAMCDEFFKKLNDFNTQEFMPRWNVLSKDDIKRIVDIVDSHSDVAVTLFTNLRDECGLDSLDEVEIYLSIEQEFGIKCPEEEWAELLEDKLLRVLDIVLFVERKLRGHK